VAPPSDKQRLFFALWPTDDVRARLAREAQSHAALGRAIPARNLHVTLVFIGAVAQSRVTEVLQAAAVTAGVRFSLQLDRLEYWRRSDLICLTAGHAPAALLSLVDELRGNLLARGFQLREQAFRPHVTLVRDVARGPDAGDFAPLQWPVAELVLVESKVGQRGSDYAVVARWPLL
jgi:RNA 2',3'-cyclic 3'-phosphodiesterase